MPKPTMEQALAAIRDALRDPASLDHPERRALAALHEDIERALEASEELRGDTGSRVNAGSAGLVSRLGSSHPKLAAALNRLADALTSMGI